jgi:hypothetical protein
MASDRAIYKRLLGSLWDPELVLRFPTGMMTQWQTSTPAFLEVAPCLKICKRMYSSNIPFNPASDGFFPRGSCAAPSFFVPSWKFQTCGSFHLSKVGLFPNINKNIRALPSKLTTVCFNTLPNVIQLEAKHVRVDEQNWS